MGATYLTLYDFKNILLFYGDNDTHTFWFTHKDICAGLIRICTFGWGNYYHHERQNHRINSHVLVKHKNIWYYTLYFS